MTDDAPKDAAEAPAGAHGVDIHRERGYFTATRPGTGQLPNCKIASVQATAVPRIAAVFAVGKMQGLHR